MRVDIFPELAAQVSEKRVLGVGGRKEELGKSEREWEKSKRVLGKV